MESEMFEVTIKNKQLFDFRNYCLINNINFDLVIEKFMMLIEPIYNNTSVISSVDEKINTIMKYIDNNLENQTKMISNQINNLSSQMSSEVSSVMMNNMNTMNNVLSNAVNNINTNVNNNMFSISSNIINGVSNGVSNSVCKEVKNEMLEMKREIKKDENNNLEMQVLSMNTMLNNLSNTIMQMSVLENGNTQEMNKNLSNMQMNLNELLNKISVSSTKGAISENILLNVLSNMFPTEDVRYVSETKESGDIILMREGKSSLLIENKCYNTNLPTYEVDKFIRDCGIQKMSGILMSQTSGIVGKTNFQIQVNKMMVEGKENVQVLVYMSNVNYDKYLISTAINIIDHLSLVLKVNKNEMEKEEEMVKIDNRLLETINNEYNQQMTKRCQMIKRLNEFMKEMIVDINGLMLPSLEKYLGERFMKEKTEIVSNVCIYCGGQYKMLSNHVWQCKKNPASVPRTGSSKSCDTPITMKK
jgi:hypothetical protein